MTLTPSPLRLVPLRQWLATAIAILVSGAVGILVSISFATLIFSGDLKPYLSQGIGIALFSAVVFRSIVAWRSSIPGVIADTDALPSAILAISAAAIQAQLGDTATADELFWTVVGAIALTSIVTGGLLLLLGFLNVGDLTRFIPYPVVGGFIASSGWLLMIGAIQMLTDQSFTIVTLPTLLSPERLLQWGPGVLYGLGLAIAARRWSNPLLLPLGLVGAVALVYGVLLLAFGSLTAPEVQPWLLETVPSGTLWQPPRLDQIAGIHGSVVLSQWTTMVSVAVITSILILLTVSGLDMLTQRDANLNQELKVAGIANLVSGLGGGMVGLYTLGDTLLAHQMGAGNRAVGVWTAALAASVLLVGSSVLSYFPRPVLGCLLFYLGLSLALEWLYDAWFKLPRSDYWVVVVIVLVVATVGILPGLVAGAIASLLLFIANYSQVSVAKHVLSGMTYRSRVVRSVQQSRTLAEQGDQIYILELQGFIFFGTAHQLLNQIQQRLADSDRIPLRFIILDFRQVTGLDSSTTFSFVKLQRLLEPHQLQLVVTQIRPRLLAVLQRADLTSAVADDSDELIHFFPDLDRGMEWCEQQILESMTWRRKRFTPLTLQLQKAFPDPDQVAPFVKYLEKRQLEPGDWLFKAGDRPTTLYFIESGQITTFRGHPDDWAQVDRPHGFRVQTLAAGTTVGEIEFYLQRPYRVSALGDRSTTLYGLTSDRLVQVQNEKPEVAIAFQQFINVLLAERLSQVYQELDGLVS